MCARARARSCPLSLHSELRIVASVARDRALAAMRTVSPQQRAWRWQRCGLSLSRARALCLTHPPLALNPRTYSLSLPPCHSSLLSFPSPPLSSPFRVLSFCIEFLHGAPHRGGRRARACNKEGERAHVCVGVFVCVCITHNLSCLSSPPLARARARTHTHTLTHTHSHTHQP